MSTPQNQSGGSTSGPQQPVQQPVAQPTQQPAAASPVKDESTPQTAQSAPATSGQTAAQPTSTASSGTSTGSAEERGAQKVSDREASGAAKVSAIGEPTQSGTTRVFMNTSTCEGIDDEEIPFPVRQQLGNHMGLLDARSGNGVWDELGNPSQGTGRGISEVTYHLDSTEPPSEPVGGPGTQSGRAARAVDRPAAGTVQRTGGPGSEVHRQGDSDQITVQRTQEGRNDRIMAAAEKGEQGQDVVAVLDHDDDSVVEGHRKTSQDPAHTLGSGASHQEVRSASPQSNTAAQSSDEVPNGSGNDVLKWAGDDKSRLRRALEAEQSKEQPRTTLVRQLSDKL